MTDGVDPATRTAVSHALASLDARHRRLLVLRVAFRVLGTTALVLAVYFVVPIGQDTSVQRLVVLAASIVAFTVAVVVQIRRIIDAPLPQLRAIEAIATIIPVFTVIFALVYTSMAEAQPESFNQPISRMSGLYFTVTVLSTVGFGDIVARTDAARAVVTVQMVLDLAIIGGVVRAIIHASRLGLERRNAEATDRPGQDGEA